MVLLACAARMLVALPRIIDALKAGEAPPRAPAPGLLRVARPGRVSGLFDRTAARHL